MMLILLPAWLGGLLLASAAGPLGALITWNRMTHFGDALAHGALLGVALAHYTHSSLLLCLLITGSVLACALHWVENHIPILSPNATLSIFSQAGLAVGTILLSQAGPRAQALSQYLFGDPLAIGLSDLPLLALLTLSVLSVLGLSWKPMVATVVDAELADVEGIPTWRYQLLLRLLTAVTLALSMRYFGALLVITLLTLPASTAQCLAASPEQAALLSMPIGMLSTSLGLLLSAHWEHCPPGPAIVCVATLLFVAALLAYCHGKPRALFS